MADRIIAGYRRSSAGRNVSLRRLIGLCLGEARLDIENIARRGGDGARRSAGGGLIQRCSTRSADADGRLLNRSGRPRLRRHLRPEDVGACDRQLIALHLDIEVVLDGQLNHVVERQIERAIHNQRAQPFAVSQA